MSLAQLKELKTVITAKAVANPTHLCKELAEQFGVSRSTMGKWLRMLIADGWLTRQGKSHPVYKPSVLRDVSRSYVLTGLDEVSAFLSAKFEFFDFPKTCRPTFGEGPLPW